MREQMRQTMRMAFTCGCLNLAFYSLATKAAAYLSFDYLNRVWVYNLASTRAYFETTRLGAAGAHDPVGDQQWALVLDFMRSDENTSTVLVCGRPARGKGCPHLKEASI